MGLDMYALATKNAIDDFGFEQVDGIEPTEIHYWRKNRHLHNWMERLWEEKKVQAGEFKTADGSYGDDFNCVYIRLNEEDLNRLENDIKSRNLPSDDGFFFGHNDYNDSYADEDLCFISTARDYLNSGYAVYYTSWW